MGHSLILSKSFFFKNLDYFYSVLLLILDGRMAEGSVQNTIKGLKRSCRGTPECFLGEEL